MEDKEKTRKFLDDAMRDAHLYKRYMLPNSFHAFDSHQLLHIYNMVMEGNEPPEDSDIYPAYQTMVEVYKND